MPVKVFTPFKLNPLLSLSSPLSRSGVTAPGADEMTPPSVTREFRLAPVVKTVASFATELV